MLRNVAPSSDNVLSSPSKLTGTDPIVSRIKISKMMNSRRRSKWKKWFSFLRSTNSSSCRNIFSLVPHCLRLARAFLVGQLNKKSCSQCQNSQAKIFSHRPWMRNFWWCQKKVLYDLLTIELTILNFGCETFWYLWRGNKNFAWGNKNQTFQRLISYFSSSAHPLNFAKTKFTEVHCVC